VTAICLWLIIPFVWTATEVPTMSQRKCVSPYYVTFQLVEIAYHICLIAVTAVLASANKELDAIVHPVFIMLLELCLFERASFSAFCSTC